MNSMAPGAMEDTHETRGLDRGLCERGSVGPRLCENDPKHLDQHKAGWEK